MAPIPILSEVLERLRARAEALRARGVVHVSVFGSVVRGEQRADSDVDLLVEATPEIARDLFAFAGVAADLEEIIGHSVDVAERSRLRAHVRPAAEAQAVRAF